MRSRCYASIGKVCLLLRSWASDADFRMPRTRPERRRRCFSGAPHRIKVKDSQRNAIQMVPGCYCRYASLRRHAMLWMQGNRSPPSHAYNYVLRVHLYLCYIKYCPLSSRLTSHVTIRHINKLFPGFGSLYLSTCPC